MLIREIANGIFRKENVHSAYKIVSMTVDVLLNIQSSFFAAKEPD